MCLNKTEITGCNEVEQKGGGNVIVETKGLAREARRELKGVIKDKKWLAKKLWLS
jgi:hypothetical protein